MKADSKQFLNSINDYNADCLRSLALSLYEELEELKLRQYANERIYNKTAEFEDGIRVEVEEQPEERNSRVINFTDHKKNNKKKNSKPENGNCNGRQKQNRLVASMEKLPKQLIYDFDPKTLDEEYGQHNWRIAFWHCHTTLEKLDSP